MKILIFGATGMIGHGVLRESLADVDVTAVTAIGRSATSITHPKLHQILHKNLTDYSQITPELTGFDACFFCLGVSSVGLTEAAYTAITYNITIAAAETLSRLNPSMVFIYVTAIGTDSAEQGRSMWARVKGKTENALLRLPFKAAYMFRPGMIQPLYGARSKVPAYRLIYIILSPFLSFFRRIAPNHVLTTQVIGQAMLIAAKHGAPKPLLESKDINALLVSHAQTLP
jgi:uncharacterized protein YbjT (DUF2867 family)